MFLRVIAQTQKATMRGTCFMKTSLMTLQQTYDFIFCSEVVEHFHNPAREFKRLHNLLKPGARLYCMTSVYYPGLNFSGWQYKNDLTNVFIYGHDTFAWIQKNLVSRNSK